MYKIKANGKYVLLLKDLGLTISYENQDGIIIDDEQFETSNDIKKLIRYLHIEKVDDVNKIKDSKSQEKVLENKENDVFIAREENTEIPDGVFVRMPSEDETTQVELSSVENAKEEVQKEKVEDSFNKIEKEVNENLNSNEVESEVITEEVKTETIDDSKTNDESKINDESKTTNKRGRKPKNSNK